MSTVKSDFLHELESRGYVHQITDEPDLDKLARTETITGYIGFDCTAPSLHVGHLLSIMMLRKLQQTGHRPIVLIGGGTTKVGDPSGKDEARKLLSDAEIASNIAGIEQVFTKFLSFGKGASDALMINNADWLDRLNYIDFLRDYGRHFSINRMLTYDSVKLRLEREQPLSFIEFNYMVLQAYDFIELYQRYGCRLQMGGSDQWGNIVSGIELGRRTDGAELFGLTSLLLTTSSGAKMGKTAQGAVWLNPDMLSPLRLLAILAELRGRRCRALSEAVHRTPAQGDRQTRQAQGCGVERGQKDPRHGGDGAGAWSGCRGPSGGHRASDVRARRDRGEPADRRSEARGAQKGCRRAQCKSLGRLRSVDR